MIFHDCDGNRVAYDNSPLTWRVSVYAIIIADEKLFIIKNDEEKLYDIPGGGIDINESIEAALERECIEEAGIQVQIGRILHVKSDYFYHRELKKFYKTIQLFYTAEYIHRIGKPKDLRTSFADYVPLSKLQTYPLPSQVIEALQYIEK